MGDRGHAGVELALAVALLLIPASLVVLGFGPWTERTVFAEAAAAEAVREAVLSLSEEAGDSVVAGMAANYGLPVDEVRSGWCGEDPQSGGAGTCSFSRGNVVTIEVEVWVPLIVTPWGSMGGLWVGTAHSEAVDRYRSLE